MMSFRFSKYLLAPLLLIHLGFTAQAKPVEVAPLFESLSRSADATVRVSSDVAEYLSTVTTSPVSIPNFPLADGSSETFIVEPFSIFAPTARVIVMKADGTSETIARPDIKAFSGRGQTNPENTLYLSIMSDNQVRAVVFGDSTRKDTIIAPAEKTDSRLHRVVAGDMIPSGFCQVNPSNVISGSTNVAAPTEAGPRSDTMLKLDVMFDASFTLYTHFGSDANATSAYITNLVGAVSTIYQRDLKTYLNIADLTVWSTLDPMDAPTAPEQLQAYGNYCNVNRTGVDRDVSHYVSTNGLNGYASVDTLCFGYGVSNIAGSLIFPIDLNQYYFDFMVIAHEIGHNVGSPHTHCYTPPIDCCALEPGCSGCAAVAPQIGTIMSYCHLGLGMEMKFHPTCIALMRSKLEAAACIDPYISGPLIAVSGNGVAIPGGSTAPSLLNLTNFGILSYGAPPVIRQFTIENKGDQPLNLTGPSPVTGSGSPAFIIGPQPAPLSIAPGATATFGIGMNSITPGLQVATISIAGNDTAHSPYTFTIAGLVGDLGPPQTFSYTGAQVDIPDGDPAGATVAIPVSGVPGTLFDLDILIGGTNCSANNDLEVGIQHPFVGDLEMNIASPALTPMLVFTSPGPGIYGAAGRNFCGTKFSFGEGSPIETITDLGAPYTGVYSPTNGNVFFGENPNGNWLINVSDGVSDLTGVLRSVSLIITPLLPIPAAANDWSLYY